MKKSKTTSDECERVARYIMESGRGMTPSEIPESIISRDRVYIALHNIRKVKRFVTKSRKVKVAAFSHICPDGRIQDAWKTWVIEIKPAISGVSVAVKATKGDDVYVFGSMMEAEKIGGFTKSCISACLSGKQTHHAGYTWEKITDAEDRQKARGKAAAARQGVWNNDRSTVQQGDAEHMGD